MTRVDSGYNGKTGRRIKPTQKEPRHGTRLRELWDLFHVYRGEPITPPFASSFWLEQLRNFYGCDIRRMGPRYLRLEGRSVPSSYCLVGEWINGRYVDYLAQRIHKADRKADRKAEPK